VTWITHPTLSDRRAVVHLLSLPGVGDVSLLVVYDEGVELLRVYTAFRRVVE